MNNNYAKILKAGFDIEIKSQDSAMARIYLTQNGKRTGDWVTFTSGHRTASTLTEALSSKRVNTHLDRALARLSMVETVAEAIKACLERDALQGQVSTAEVATKPLKI
ncbi:hypothetical protein [Variovorax sp. W2I14]|uniref:hypothetical protein n=1 Tax=Variovorax sp. W2I14 TaxID=3042290 RepID=UPI003D1AD0B2